MKKISFEEHYLIDAISFQSHDGVVSTDLMRKLFDLGEERLNDMDEAGIDMQVLFPGVLALDDTAYTEKLDALDGIALAKTINDELSKVVKRYPERFSGFASLPMGNPRQAADELERAVKDLGLKGGDICSNVRGEYLDGEKFGVFFERAEKLGVPIYIHPRQPSLAIRKPFTDYPGMHGSMFGFAIDASLNALRMIYGGVFDKYPGLKIVLGHMGEALPFWMWRIDNRLQKETVPRFGMKIRKNPSQYIKENIFMTTSGMFFLPALVCAYLALGADRILFAVDYPMESNKVAVEFMEAAPTCDSDKEKIYHLNAERLLGL